MAKMKSIEKGFCSLCGRALLMPEGDGILQLKDGARICSHCKRKLRVRYPLSMEKTTITDPMKEITIEKAREDLETITEFIEDLRDEYDGCNAILKIISVDKEKGGIFKPSTYHVTGQVIYGNFDPEDSVILMHQDAKTELTISDTRRVTMIGNTSTMKRAEAGNICTLSFEGKNVTMEAGDLIVRN